MSPILEAHLARLKERQPNALSTELPSSALLIEIPSHPLVAGWSSKEVKLYLLAPNGYPVAAPDCLWVQPNLTFGSQQIPRNSQINHPIPETGIVGHWFSWHVEQGRWSANTHDLLTWLGLCEKRLQSVQ